MTTRWLIAIATAVLATGVMACSGDDNATPAPVPDAGGSGSDAAHADSGGDAGKDSGTDATTDGSTHVDAGGDTGLAPGSDSGSDAEAGNAFDAGPCDFAAFVTGLIQNDTTMSALPSTDLGQSCVDKQDQTQFQPLFQ